MIATSITSVLKPLQYVRHRASERFNDWKLGIHTDAVFWPEDIGEKDPDLHIYHATSYRKFRKILNGIEVEPGQDVFLDYGSGMGRVVVLAAMRPFKRVIGVELSQQLHQIAKHNVNTARANLQCADIELHAIDARAFVVPNDVTKCFFWSPFGETVLEEVLLRIRQSFRKNPRDVQIIYVYASGSSCLDPLLPKLQWLKNLRHIDLGGNLWQTTCTLRA